MFGLIVILHLCSLDYWCLVCRNVVGFCKAFFINFFNLTFRGEETFCKTTPVKFIKAQPQAMGRNYFAQVQFSRRILAEVQTLALRL